MIVNEVEYIIEEGGDYTKRSNNKNSINRS